MTMDTGVFRRTVTEAVAAERRKAISKIVEIMEWTVRFGGFDAAYRQKCAEALYDGPDCKDSGVNRAIA